MRLAGRSIKDVIGKRERLNSTSIGTTGRTNWRPAKLRGYCLSHFLLEMKVPHEVLI